MIPDSVNRVQKIKKGTQRFLAKCLILLMTRGFSVGVEASGLNQAPVALYDDQINFVTLLVLFGFGMNFLRLAGYKKVTVV